MFSYWEPLVGGMVIGLAGIIMLLFNGKILGVSGIVGGILTKNGRREPWRYAFLAGLVLGGVWLSYLHPEAFSNSVSRTPVALGLAGLLVGFGTRLGNGCTSGHGVCGVSRLSPRSLAATATFMFFGALTVWIVNHFLGGRL